MHNQFEEEASLSPLSYATSGTPQPHPRLEDYLDRLCVPLVEELSYGERAVIRQEVRTHLLAIVAAHEELGSPPEEAVQFALQQFGEAKEIGNSFLETRIQQQSTSQMGRLASLQWWLLSSVTGSKAGMILALLLDRLCSVFRPIDYLFGPGRMSAYGLMVGFLAARLAANPRCSLSTVMVGSGIVFALGHLMLVDMELGQKYLPLMCHETLFFFTVGAIGGGLLKKGLTHLRSHLRRVTRRLKLRRG